MDSNHVSAENPALNTPQPYAVRRQPYDLTGADLRFALALLAGTALAVCAGIWGGFQAGFTASFVVLFLTFSVYLGHRGSRPGAFACVCGALAFSLSTVFVCTSGTLVRFLALCAECAFSVVWFAALAGKPIPPGELGLASCVLRHAAQTLAKTPKSVSSLFRGSNPRVKKASKALLGVVCALPILCVVAALLIRSDAAFEGLMQRMFGDAGRVAGQTAVTLCLFPPLLSLGFSVKKEPLNESAFGKHKGVDTGFLAAFLGLLDVCYAAYLFSQLAYFFSAFSGILPEGFAFTYADYARRGFFELCGIAAVNLAALYGMLLLSRKTDGKLPLVLRALGTFTDLFTLVLICTAAAKLALYIRQFGMTVQRLNAAAAMLCMAATFLVLLVRFFAPRVRVLPVAAVTAAVLILVLGIGNVHAFCARYNYEAYATGSLETIDTAYLRRLGDEGIPYLVRLTKDKNPGIRKNACGQLCLAIEERYDGETEYVTAAPRTDWEYLIPDSKKITSPAAWSIPRARAYAALDALLVVEPDFTRDHAEERQTAWENDWAYGMF